MILALIPARGGSKGIPRKNIKPIAGKPLMVWSIEAAKKSKLIDCVAVSTEDAEIAQIARGAGAKVTDRPSELATDEASTLSVLQHALEVEPNVDTVVLLQATSPIRNDGLIDECIERFQKSNADSLVTGFICKYIEYGKNELRRQDIKGFFYDDGNIYIIRADLLRKGDRYGARIERVILDKEQNVDVDDEFDFWVAEQVLKRRMNAASFAKDESKRSRNAE